MAALHWPPQTVWHGASLRDIHEACRAWQRMNAPQLAQTQRPDKNFLQQMMQKFPDQPRERKTRHGR